MKLFFPITILLLTICVLAAAQETVKPCVANRTAPPMNGYYWPPDTTVNVYFIRNMFTTQQRETLFAAMNAWSNAASRTGAGVKFAYQGEVDGLIDCNACLTITRRVVNKYDRKHYAFFNPLKRDSDGLLISAWSDFDFATTSPQALQAFMAHELGHGMGLWDCTSCKKKKTIMNAFTGINRDNGLVEPSTCDLEIVRQVYQLHRRVSSNVVSESDDKQN